MGVFVESLPRTQPEIIQAPTRLDRRAYRDVAQKLPLYGLKNEGQNCTVFYKSGRRVSTFANAPRSANQFVQRLTGSCILYRWWYDVLLNPNKQFHIQAHHTLQEEPTHDH